ncbi:unnamed protein product [Dovyalis caffra]|uniref:Galactinol--sucrose galactosyltransferase n=1 Tax=Dovyalis caffra TaxID=77055 RepID=A0AAV1QQ92_9ROSI|nr:unnamed protein product [Dovyalis caffra]
MAPSLSKNALDVVGLVDGEQPLSITLEGRTFLANGHPILTEVLINIIATPSPFISSNKAKNLVGCFVGFDAYESKSQHAVSFGKLSGIRFVSIFRFKIWWTTHWIGSSGKDGEHETQNMILDSNDWGRPYVLLLPLLEGPFRTSLQPGVDDSVEICAESGSTQDAFCLTVDPKGVWEGVKGLVEGGRCPPRELQGLNPTAAGEQMPWRLVKFEENYKFRDYESPNVASGKRMRAFIRDLKEEFGTEEHVYVWHALCGYWGGIRPNVGGNVPESRVIRPKLSPGLQMTMGDLAVDKIINNGVGLVPPERAYKINFRSNGFLQLLEMLSEEFGGRVALAEAYYKALTASVKKHFKANGVIASMEHCNDFMFLGTEAIALGRVVTHQEIRMGHIGYCAYNSLWMGNFIHLDWDMFQSTHPCAEFHAASRAISGGPIYVSDSVGYHNFKLLKALVLPDGYILRCQYYALPTRDSLFEDPLHDGKTMLKIWNLNKHTGVLGIFNCQGGGWCPLSRRNKSSNQYSRTVISLVSPKDIEWNSGKSPISVTGVDKFAVYSFKEKKVKLLKSSDNLEISLEPFNYELFTVSPVTVLPRKLVQLAPLGLVNMLNTGGAIKSPTVIDDENLKNWG